MKTLLSLVLGGIVFAVAFKYAELKHDQVLSAGQTIAGFAGTVFGALVAALAIVTAVIDRPLISNMRKSGHWDVLVRNTVTACATMLITASLAIAAMFVGEQTERLVIAAAAGLGVSGVGLLLNVAHQYRQVIKYL
jgi:hypothetical protein